MGTTIAIWMLVALVSIGMLAWDIAAQEVISRERIPGWIKFIARYSVPFILVILIVWLVSRVM